MNDSGVTPTGQQTERRSSARHLWLAIGTACYVIAGTAGLIAGAQTIGLTPLLWVVYAVGLLVLLARLGGIEVGCAAGVFVLLVSGLSFYIGSGAWDDLVLQQRGRTVQALVMKERVERGSRGDRTWFYELIHRDGLSVPGPQLESDSDRFNAGQTITVIEDPKGQLAPQTPGEASPAGDLLGAGGPVLVCLGAVGWTAFRGRKSKEDRMPLWKRKTAEAPAGAPVGDQEQRLREVLRARNFDRRGYIRVSPGGYTGMTHHRAAQIAREEGLRAEAFGNRGYWRFGEKVVEEVE
ncbi:hypothetical protein [Streptomyces lutosisoli]|uniref:DUF4178 domain-containing protein n=1 Tax=Streptomyces lutosisoli TaxID=2665721 RepID=A0ABW2VAP7_9ACTN